MSRTPLARLLLALVAVVALVAACGDDDTDDATDGVDTEAPAGDTDAGTDDADVADDGDVDLGAMSEECRELSESIDPGDLGASLGTGDDPTDEIRRTSELLAAAAEGGPDEIAGDLQVLAELWDDLADASANVDWDALADGDPEAMASAQEFSQVFADDDFTEAATNVSDWVTENCGG